MQEELVENQQKSANIQTKHAKRDLTTVLANNPRVWVTLNKYAQTLGYTPDSTILGVMIMRIKLYFQ